MTVDEMIGKTFGELTVISNEGYGKLLCKCSCGNYKTVRKFDLEHDRVKSCGCQHYAYNAQYKDIVGQQFGYLTVLKRVENTIGGQAKFLCKCICGKERIVVGSRLRNGGTKSCGCIACGHKRNKWIGRRYGRLVITGIAKERSKQTGRNYYTAHCDCGNDIEVQGSALTSGDTTSCGCVHREMLSARSTTHGMSNSRLFWVFSNIKSRCYNPHNRGYKNYGGRGITIFDEWLGENGFQAFYDWAMANGYDETAKRGICTIDRIDVNGNYEPSNCRWVNMTVQANNKRTNSCYIVNGEKLTLSQISKKYNINVGTLGSRLKKGLDIEEAIKIPIKRTKKTV